jgi:hypothetical protein
LFPRRRPRGGDRDAGVAASGGGGGGGGGGGVAATESELEREGRTDLLDRALELPRLAALGDERIELALLPRWRVGVGVAVAVVAVVAAVAVAAAARRDSALRRGRIIHRATLSLVEGYGVLDGDLKGKTHAKEAVVVLVVVKEGKQ